MADSLGGDRLSIVIVSYNTAQHLRRCLQSLRNNPAAMPQEVIVVDNASADGSEELVRREFPECQLIQTGDNLGYGSALNRGVGVATGNYLLFLNPDTEVEGGSLDTLVEFARAHPQAGVIAPRLMLSKGQPQPSARRRLSPCLVLLEASRLHFLLPKRVRARVLLGTYFNQDVSLKVDWVSGACHLIPRAVWKDLGPLTEETFCGFDDYDYCHRARKRGYEVWHCAEAVVHHHCSVAVRDRWSSWEVEQVAAHNTYVVLETHWSKWRIKLFNIAEVCATLSELLRHTLWPRKEYADLEGGYRGRLMQRVHFLWSLLRGKLQPIRRFQKPPKS